jgi:uncharacterized membrane protein YoaK (UPF0700 family)
MLIHEGETRTTATDLILASVLAFVAGGVNSAGFLSFGYLSANMTGNVSMISDHISTGAVDIALSFAAIVLMFIAGAFAASCFIEYGKKKRFSNTYALTLLVEVMLLMGCGLYSAFFRASANATLVAGLLSFTMGIQNAASTRISGSRIRTTHISGIATDIGVGLSLILGGVGADDRPQLIDRLRLHLATILAFLIGGIAGVLGFMLAGGLAFCGFSLVLMTLCARYVRRKSTN